MPRTMTPEEKRLAAARLRAEREKIAAEEAAMDPRNIQNEEDVLSYMGKQFGKFKKMMNQSPDRPRPVSGLKLPLPGVFESLFNFVGKSLLIGKDPKMKAIWETQKGVDQISFGVEFLAGLVKKLMGPKAWGKIQPLYNGLMGMLGMQVNRVKQEMVDSGRFTKDEMKEYDRLSEKGRVSTLKGVDGVLTAFRSYTKQQSGEKRAGLAKRDEQGFSGTCLNKPRRRMR